MARSRFGDTTDDTLPLSRTSAEKVRHARSADAAFSLLIYHRDGVRVVPLRAGDPVTIGRGTPSDVVLIDRSLSRQHARFSYDGTSLSVEDLGSTNGTRVAGELIEKTQLRPGERVELGAVLVSLQMRSALEPEVAGLEGHDAFCSALEAELERSRFFDEPLALLFVTPLERQREGAHVSRWWGNMRTCFRPSARAALYSNRAVEVLLPRVGAADALTRARELVERAPRGPQLACGVASWPECGNTGDQLLEALREAAHQASRDEPAVMLQPAQSQRTTVSSDRDGPIANSPPMRALYETVNRVADTKLPVLVRGETGTGKEVVARAIHDRGPRRDAPMVCINCGAIPRQLVESTLFGHVKGAFTGADRSSRGVFGSADGGTVLLDEVGELPAAAQAALLRVLESGQIQPVGGTTEQAVDVRVIAATHRDLDAMSETNAFRRDLLFRLNAFTIDVPALRDRTEDLTALAHHFLAHSMTGGRDKTIDPVALGAMQRYSWPGNVRELRNAIERAAVIADDDIITVDDLPQRVRDGVSTPPAEAPLEILDGEGDLKTRVRRHEAQLIEAALRQCGGNQTEAAKLLGVPVRTLSDKIRRLRIQV